MKSYKQLREKWKQSVKYSFNQKKFFHVDVFENPSRKEIIEAGGNRGGFRGFLLPSKGKMFVWSANAIHVQVADKVIKGSDKFDYIAIKGDINGSEIYIEISPFTGTAQKWTMKSIREVAEAVRNHKHLNKIFSNIVVNDQRFFA